MKKINFAAIIIALCATTFMSLSAQAQKKHKSTESEAFAHDTLAIANADLRSDKVRLETRNFFLERLADSLEKAFAPSASQISSLQQQLQNCGLQTSTAVNKSNTLQHEVERLQDALEKIKSSKDSTGFLLNSMEISDLVLDSAAIALVKNMELGKKFFQMSPEELASDYSGLNLNWQRSPTERYLMSRRSIRDISTAALQSEIKKWMMYLYDNSTGATRLRLSKLFLNITGDNYFSRKY